MSSSYTDSLKLEKQATGANANTWGNNTNNNLEVVDAFNSGYLSKSVAGSADVTLTTANADPAAESSNKVIEFTGTLTGNIKVFVPAVENNYIFFNNTAGSFSLTVAPTGHAANGVAIAQGAHTIQYCKGNRIVDLFASSFGNISAKTQIKIGDNVKLNANGVVQATTLLGNGAGLSGVEEFAAGTKPLFVQTASPTGFTTDTTATLSECCLQVVNGTGGGTGGSDAFSSTFTGSKSATVTDAPIDISSLSVSSNYAIGAHTLSTPEMAGHTHTIMQSAPSSRLQTGNEPVPRKTAGAPSNVPADTGNTGGGGSHTHPLGSFSLSGTLTSPLSASVPNMNLKFADSIISVKD